MATHRNPASNPNQSSVRNGSSNYSSNGSNPSQGLPTYYSPSHPQHKPKAGPNRSTKGSGKLKILPSDPQEAPLPLPTNPNSSSTSINTSTSRPSATLRAKPTPSKKTPAASVPNVRPSNPSILKHHQNQAQGGSPSSDEDEDDVDEDEDEDEGGNTRNSVGDQLNLIPEGSMRRDARRLTRKARAKLPRVTAYSTATSYRMRDLCKFLNARRDSHRTNPMTFDECVYTTYTYEVVDAARGIHSDAPSNSGPPPKRNHHHQQHQSSNSQHQQSNSSSTHQNSNSQNQPPQSPGGGRHSGQYGRTGDLLGIPELTQEEEEDENENGGESKSKSKSNTNTNIDEGGNGNNNNGFDQNGNSTDATLIGSNSSNLDQEPSNSTSENLETKRKRREERFIVKGLIPEIFIMEYGTIVIWGMTLAQEKRLLRELKRFEVERLAQEDVESEDLNWYLADYSRIYNDVITLRKGSSYMTKLSLSHALAQSTKISFFEGIIDNTIETTKDIPQSIAESGKIGMPPAEIMKQIGHLFILRMNIHLVGSIVDSPEIFWAQPDLEPLYSAARSYLEIPQRIELLNTRVEVLQDMLQLLKDQVTSSHSEWLEIIVIVLIVLEIILGVATMIVDLYFA